MDFARHSCRPASRSSTSRSPATARTPAAGRCRRRRSRLHQPQRHGEARRLPPVDQRSRRLGRTRRAATSTSSSRRRSTMRPSRRRPSSPTRASSTVTRVGRHRRRGSLARSGAAGRRRFRDRRADRDPRSTSPAATGPPPGDREECFKVETGEVDCVPGGGAFIYHMPVGPEFGGKWVQLRTTTPGIIVAPLSQLVPIGGGVLNWTITGALPGDVVHLIVTGIETYAGPEEGVGLCCTQTIDIVIPPDLECPPEAASPTSRSRRRPTIERCTPEGPLRLHHPRHQCRRRAVQRPDRARRGDRPRHGAGGLRTQRALGLPADGQPDELHASRDHAQPRRIGRAEARLRARTRLGLGLHPQLRRVRLHGERHSRIVRLDRQRPGLRLASRSAVAAIRDATRR